MLLSSLLLGGAPAGAAEQLDVHLDGLILPLDLRQLEDWSRSPTSPQGDLGVWMTALDAGSREDLARLLRAPLLRDRSLGQQLLQSWAGRQVVAEVGELISAEGGGSGELLLSSLRELLRRQAQVNVLDLLRAVPVQRLTLQLDGLISLADRWRHQLQEQGRAMERLRQLSLPLTVSPAEATAGGRVGSGDLADRPPAPERLSLPVAHRPGPLPLLLWRARPERQRHWVLLMPGLGGSAEQLDWLGAELAARGWSVVALEHPGSDEKAVKELLDGRRPLPGAETLPDRLADLEAVLDAERSGRLPRLGDSVVLMGHSLGGLSALLAAGLRPEPGLGRRCQRALDAIPLINLSRLLQCQLEQVNLPPARTSVPVAGVVAFNGFGSLLWPHRGLQRLKVPVLLLGGSLDLVTPPVTEQLDLFLPANHPLSRLVVVDGASHFSPVRLPSREQALFKIGDALVGVEPLQAQALMLQLTTGFLAGLDQGRGLPAQKLQRERVTAYVLDAEAAEHWRLGP
ncbi:alpha/beta fold hydrolase [Cyanobium sp. Morenito 9A2]|uniref:alpha/beta fold hydrolase n=1 Tax=Cyanobium sp. Morenito 9A2 TaxID=2823718 RepID=UPI0020CF7515|nr:alpha/beta fold hydrolase [Cyanobium sp. Morenito 9A2]MCP9850714.1 alpha/beta fold hydrolase [Cyanobium sp. Morenito 9A2]